MPNKKNVSFTEWFASVVKHRQEENRRCSTPEMIVAGKECCEMTEQQKQVYKPNKNSRSKYLSY